MTSRDWKIRAQPSDSKLKKALNFVEIMQLTVQNENDWREENVGAEYGLAWGWTNRARVKSHKNGEHNWFSENCFLSPMKDVISYGKLGGS